MPRDAITLADVRSATLTIVCEPCARRGRYNVERLIAKHGLDMKMPDLRAMLANCDRARSSNVYDRCKARFAPYDCSGQLWSGREEVQAFHTAALSAGVRTMEGRDCALAAIHRATTQHLFSIRMATTSKRSFGRADKLDCARRMVAAYIAKAEHEAAKATPSPT